MAERFRCSVLSGELAEPCYGTASQIRRWILVEQPGAWGIDALLHSDIPADVGLRLRAVARAAGARLLLIRRHGRSAPVRRTCFAVVSTAGVQRVERFIFDDPGELLGVDWTPLRAFEPVGGELLDDPVFLVCTNGSHDACCAEFGRPVAAALDAVLGPQVWESSHFGGDRFAGTLVCLPAGIYYGRVTPEDAPRLVDLHARGQLDLAHYRGRSWQPFVAQAAEFLVREQRGLTPIDGLVPGQPEDLGEGRFAVPLETPFGDRVVATVECTYAQQEQQLTCRSRHEERPPRYRLLGLA